MPRRLISTGSPLEKTVGYSHAVIDSDFAFVAGTTSYPNGQGCAYQGKALKTRSTPLPYHVQIGGSDAPPPDFHRLAL